MKERTRSVVDLERTVHRLETAHTFLMNTNKDPLYARRRRLQVTVELRTIY